MAHAGLTAYKLVELLTGEIMYPMRRLRRLWHRT